MAFVFCVARTEIHNGLLIADFISVFMRLQNLFCSLIMLKEYRSVSSSLSLFQLSFNALPQCLQSSGLFGHDYVHLESLIKTEIVDILYIHVFNNYI